MVLERYGRHAPWLVRLGVGLVFLIFGVWQWIDPEYWFGYIPSWTAQLPFSNSTLILLNGTFDAVLGVLLLAGLFTRIVALLCALHLFSVVFMMGWNDIAVRDIGLAIAAIGIMLFGPDDWSLDRRWRTR